MISSAGKRQLCDVFNTECGEPIWHYIAGCCVKTGRKMAAYYIQTKLIAVSDAAKH